MGEEEEFASECVACHASCLNLDICKSCHSCPDCCACEEENDDYDYELEWWG
jgi:hypothetical protein